MPRDARRRRFNEKFSHQMLDLINATSNHPLKFLVNPITRKWHDVRHGSELPATQIGHAESFHSEARERLFLEDADFNQLSNWRGERQGVVFQKTGVLIDGVPVEKRTADMWERIGLLPKGTVTRSPKSAGWDPATQRA
ncbi:MAG: polymorphic toxin type 5 domain-containing protein [Candidatus Eisenbacteria bacterium]